MAVVFPARAGYCQWRQRPLSERAQANVALDARVSVIHIASGRSYGRPRIERDLRNQGLLVGHERVRQSLQRQGLCPVYKRPYRVTTDSDHSHPIADNLLDRRFDGWQPNQAWVGDITYVSTGEGWSYLATVIDLYSRKVIGWAMSDRMKAELACDALTMALWRRGFPKGVLVHTDRGSQYCSDKYQKLLDKHKLVCSMSGTGNCYDNACAESFFHTLKVELIHGERFDKRSDMRRAVFEYIELDYNRRRRHSAIGMVSLEAFEAQRVA